MKKPVVLIIILAALIAFAAFYQQKRDNRSNSAKLAGAPNRELLLPDLPLADIRQIRIREASNELNLEVEGNRWVVKQRNGYSASIDAITRAVQNLATLKIIGKNVVGESAFSELKLLPPAKETPVEKSGLQVELLDGKGAVLASFIAGGFTTTTGGFSSTQGGMMMGNASEQRYVRIEKDQNTVWLVNDPLHEWQVRPQEWLDKDFIKIQEIKSVIVTAVNPADSWAAERKTIDSPFELVGAANGDALDTAKANGLTTLLSNSTFTDVEAKAQVQPDFFKDATSARITTFDGFTYEVKFVIRQVSPDEEADEKSLFTYDVTANIAKTREIPADEKPEDKQKNDEAFAAKVKALEAKLEKEKTLANWVFEMSSYNVEVLRMKRAEVLREKDSAAPTPAVNAMPGLPPGVGPLTPPVSAPAPVAPPAPTPVEEVPQQPGTETAPPAASPEQQAAPSPVNP